MRTQCAYVSPYVEPTCACVRAHVRTRLHACEGTYVCASACVGARAWTLREHPCAREAAHVSVCACACGCGLAYVPVCVGVHMHACMIILLYMRAQCVRTLVGTCVRTCIVRACERICVRVCGRMSVCVPECACACVCAGGCVHVQMCLCARI